MKKLSQLFIVLMLLVACSAENDNTNNTTQQVAVEGADNSSNDPFYQLQESEAKKHKDSAPPAN